jgi:putative membrane protein
VVAALHVYFLVLEMFLWTKPLGLKTFRNTIEKATESAVLAANQGLYNGFLAAGLLWGLIHPNPGFAFQIKAFFLLCVIVAGAYGAATVSRRILYVQAAPAALALILLWLASSAFAGVVFGIPCGFQLPASSHSGTRARLVDSFCAVRVAAFGLISIGRDLR